MGKKTGLKPLVSNMLGYTPERDHHVLPEPVVKDAIRIIGPGIEVMVRKPQKVAEILERYPGSRVVK
jgi:hypothetical protein